MGALLVSADMSIEVALVTRCVVAEGTRMFPLPAVYRRVPLHQRLPAEPPSADSATVPGPGVTLGHVLTQRRFVGKYGVAALEELSTRLVHRQQVAL